MKIIYIIVEGQTEEEFVKMIVTPYLRGHNIYDVRPIKIQTSKSHKGGFVNYSHLKNDVLRLLKQQKDIIVSTLVDFFRIPGSIPNFTKAMKQSNSLQKVMFLEKSIFEDIGDSRFIPYIQLHEFEALLFSSINGFNGFWNTEVKIINQVSKIINDYPNPEDINDNPVTAPSKRLKSIIHDYNKILHGNLIAEENGIDVIIAKCPRFRNWIENIVFMAK